MLRNLSKAFKRLITQCGLGLLLAAFVGSLAACDTSISQGPVSIDLPAGVSSRPSAGWLRQVVAPAPAPTRPAPVQILDDGDERRFIELFEQTSSSVVHVHAEGQAASALREEIGQRNLEAHDFAGFRGWMSDPSGGSGFVFDEDGHVVTTNRLIAGAEAIEVTFPDGATVLATVVGADPNTDLAILKVERLPATAKPLSLANSDTLHVGQRVVAVGNPLGQGGAMTAGVVSAKARNVTLEIQIDGGFFTAPDLIQTDATITSGMVGGPLIDLRGMVVGVAGVDTLGFDVVGQTRVGGVSLSIPSSTLRRVIPVLLEKGRYPYPWLGISATDVDPELAAAMDLPPDQWGVLVMSVSPDSPSEKAGLRGSDRQVPELGSGALVGGDVITEFEGQPVTSFDELVSLLFREGSVGATVTLTIIRDGQPMQVPLTLEERP